MSSLAMGNATRWVAVLTMLIAQAKPAAQDAPSSAAWSYGAFVDAGRLCDVRTSSRHLFRNRGTAFHLNEWDLNMVGLSIKKKASGQSRVGVELTLQGGRDSALFGFSSTAPNLAGSNWLRHLGPANVSSVAPIGRGLTLQGGIFTSIIGYDSLYAKDNFNYTRPWGADYTPYLMMGASAGYPLSPRLTGTVVVANGYFHLAHANDVPSLGGQLSFALNDRTTIKQNVLIGPHQSATAFTFWRTFSDTFVERRGDWGTAAIEYQIGTERVAEANNTRALWMSAQVPLHWALHRLWSVTVRPEMTWDRDGRWIAGRAGGGQSVAAITSTVAFRIQRGIAVTTVRLEHRFDRSRGPGGGFFEDDGSLTPHQQLLIAAATITVDGSIPWRRR